MDFLVTSNLLAIILLFVLVVSGSVSLLGSIRNSRKRNRGAVMYKIPWGSDSSLDKIASAIGVPFVFEVAVSQLGREKSFFVSVPFYKSRKIVDLFGGELIKDYDLFYQGGVVVGGYLSKDVDLKNVDPQKIDFSDINEIGEGVVFQIVFHKKRRKGFECNVRILISAPSSFQAKEIFSRVKSSLPGARFTDAKGSEFVGQVSGRSFNEKERVSLIS